MPRAENDAADVLSKLDSSRQAILVGISLEHLRKPSIKPSPESESIYVPPETMSEATPMDVDVGPSQAKSVDPGTAPSNSGTAQSMSVEPMSVNEAVFTVRVVPSWVQPIMEYLISGALPSEEVQARQVQGRSKAYTIINGEMYKRSATGVL